MRKTDLRSRSFNAGSNGIPLFNAPPGYYSPPSTEEEEQGEVDNNRARRAREYELVRRISSASTTGATDSDLSSPAINRGGGGSPGGARHLLSPAASGQTTHHQHNQQRRHSQHAVLSPRSLVSTPPEFVITSASKISETSRTVVAAAPRRSSPSSYSPRRADTPDFTIYSYEDGNETRFVPSAAAAAAAEPDEVTRRKTIHAERVESPLASSPNTKQRLKDEYERRWSSDSSSSTGRRRTSRVETGEPEHEHHHHRHHQYPRTDITNVDQDRYQDPYYPPSREQLGRRRNTIVPPPTTIVTAQDPSISSPVRNQRGASPYRRLSAGAVGLHLDEQKPLFIPNTNLNLLSVPGYDSPSTVGGVGGSSASPTSVTRSRSQSTPSSPELIRLQAAGSNRPTSYEYQKRRSLSPDIGEDEMQSAYHRQRSSEQMVDTRRGQFGDDRQEAEVEEAYAYARARKHSYVDSASSRAQQRNRQNELRRISSSSTCVVEGIDTHRRRMLPPTPDQLSEKQQQQEWRGGPINNSGPSGSFERLTRDGLLVNSGASSLPSQPPPTSFYGGAGIRTHEPDEELKQARHPRDGNSRSSRQIAQSIEPSLEHRHEQQLPLQNQRAASQFDEKHDEDSGGSMPGRGGAGGRRATAAAIVDTSSMIPPASSSSPAGSASSTRCNSPRTGGGGGRGRKLPETPDISTTSSTTTKAIGQRMFPSPMARQNTVGELLHQPSSSSSPPALARFNAPPRRVSEQILPPRAMATSLAAAAAAYSSSSSMAKSPSSDNDDHRQQLHATNAAMTTPAWIGSSASSTPRSPERTVVPVSASSSSHHPQVTPARPNMGILGQFRQSSVSSSSSVPDLTPTNQMCASGGGAGIGADGATDSGHGSGAESGVGDGTTVSSSSSWPDAIGILGPPSSTSSSHQLSADASSSSSTSGSGLGLLHFTVQYFPVRKRLRVSVIKAERLAGQLRMDIELHAFVKVCLMPGKLHKQRGSRIVKRTRDAAFNEEFFFDNITTEDLESKSVHLRLCHHVGKQFQKDVVIGQLDISLKEIMGPLVAKQELKLCQELKAKQLKKLGRLQISTCLENDARRLTINIYKVDDLPKFGISGPPDPCVRISVDQNGKVQTKQSRILKSTCNAVFREAIMFLVSTKHDDLERTKIVVAVHDTARSSAGDDVIGNVYLGQLAGEKTELEQWRNTLAHPGREFKATHQLKKEPGNVDDEMLHASDD